MLFLGKAFYFTWALIIPAMFFPLWSVIAIYFAASFIEGVVLAVVFQLAHCLEEAEFPVPNSQTSRIDEEWCVHQLQTTVNFSMNNRLLSWYVGGLNYQVEHHLFPKISHVHYQDISWIVEAVCKKHGIPYKSHGTMMAGVRSHYRLLKQLGKPPNLAQRAA
jgi:linoleoyl-CoA desaturase